MSVNSKLSKALKLVGLTAFLFGLYAIDFFNFKVLSEAYTAPGVLLLVAFLHTAVLSYTISRASQSSWRLVGALFLAFYGTLTLMVAIESVYLPDALPPDIVVPMLVNGGITTFLFSCAVVLIWERWRADVSEPRVGRNMTASWIGWIGRFALIGVIWGFLFVLFGALVFLPLAKALAPEALATYINLDMPPWVLPFQVVRGIFWAALALPLLRILKGPGWMRALTLGLLFSVLMGATLLRATDLPVGLRMAHLVEVAGGNFVFGACVAWILGSRRCKDL